jgi:DivIVA domain-containing protein
MATSEPLRTASLLNPERIASQRFTVGRRGYEIEEVKAYLHSLAEEVGRVIGELEWFRARADNLERRNGSAQEAAYARLARDFTAAIKAADEAAERVIADAEQEAAAMLATASERAAGAVAKAEARAAAVMAEASDRAATLLSDAKAEADDIVPAARRQVEEVLAQVGTHARERPEPVVWPVRRIVPVVHEAPAGRALPVDPADLWSRVWHTPAPAGGSTDESSAPATPARRGAVEQDAEAMTELGLDLGIDDELLDLFDPFGDR